MKKKKLPRSSSSTACAAAILAGGVLFTGPAANAAIVFSEDFESVVNAFGMPTYAYSQNYTLPHTLTPGGGLLYGFGASGVNGQASTNSFPLLPISLTVGSGVSAAQIDAGVATYDFRAQFSTYQLQNDFAEISITFRDAFNTQLGDPVLLGGQVFVAALASGVNNSRDWGESGFQGVIPTGARTIDVLLSATKTPGGEAIDSYVDNVFLSVVPEPTTFALSAVAGLACLLRRRRPK